jgi:hypothetical protein
MVQFVCSNNVLSKFNYFERTLIRKNEKNKKNSKESNSKVKNEFRNNVIRTNDLVSNGHPCLKLVPRVAVVHRFDST